MASSTELQFYNNDYSHDHEMKLVKKNSKSATYACTVEGCKLRMEKCFR